MWRNQRLYRGTQEQVNCHSVMNTQQLSATLQLTQSLAHFPTDITKSEASEGKQQDISISCGTVHLITSNMLHTALMINRHSFKALIDTGASVAMVNKCLVTIVKCLIKSKDVRVGTIVQLHSHDAGMGSHKCDVSGEKH